jgi:hypothetical protein
MTPSDRRKAAVNFILGILLIAGAVAGFQQLRSPILPVLVLVVGIFLVAAGLLAWIAEGYQRGDDD